MEGFLHAGLLHIGIIAPSVSADGAITTKTTRVVTPGPPLPPFGTPYIPKTQVDLGRLAGPPEAITPFTVVGLVRTPTTEEERRGLPMEKPLTRATMDLSITDRSATPFHGADLPSPTPDSTNPNPNGLGSGSPPRLTTGQPHHPSGEPVTHLNPDPAGCRPPGHHHQCVSFGLDGVTSPVPPLGIERMGGAGEDGGCLDSVKTRPYGGSSAEKKRR
jgi:hypothetical protein